MPVDTRRISYAADTQAAGIQPSSMVARGQGPDPNENQPKNEQQEDKTPPKPTPGPRTPTPSAHAVTAELADVESELASAKKTAEELRNRAMSRLTGQSAQRDKKSSRKPSPPPRPRMEDAHPTLDMKELGKAIGDSIKGSLDKEDIGSYISKEEAALVQCDLSLESRKGFAAMVHSKGRLADERVDEIFAVFSATTGTPEERARIIEERNLKSVDKRLAATVLKCLKEKAPCVSKLMKAMEKDAALGVSGMRIFEWLDKETEKTVRMDPEDLMLAFKSKSFIEYDATKEVNEVNALEMISAIEALPIKYTSSPRDVLELILDKIPVQVKDEHWVDTLKNELRRAIRAGGEMPWTPEALCEEIIDNTKRSVVTKPQPCARLARTAPTAPKSGDGGARASRLNGKVMTGTIGKWLGEANSFCFIKADGEKDDVFCHGNSIVGDKLQAGTKVKFKITYDVPTTGKRGGEPREYATDVRPTTSPIANVATAAQTVTEQTETETEQHQGQVIYVNTLV